MRIARYSMGVGDRFGREGAAQLAAFRQAAAEGVDVVPVWNKSHREHGIIGTRPGDTRLAAEAAVRAASWTGAYHVDADHIGFDTVDAFLDASDFFTLDVADFIGRPVSAAEADAFAAAHRGLEGRLEVPGIDGEFELGADDLRAFASTYLAAVREAGRIHRRIAAAKGEGTFVTEVSMDECDAAQSPRELLLLLAALAAEGVPVQTIAPRFTGRFNKGVDYDGDLARFEREFRADVAVIRFAVGRFGLPPALKLSVHSGSDKFSLYPVIRRAVREAGAGLHLKTAGTTWLEELIGLAEAGPDGLGVAREVYRQAYERREALCRPYASVIDIDPARLPPPAEVGAWSGEAFAAALRHDPSQPAFNPHLRQLLHVGYKVAAEMGARFLDALEAHRPAVARNVTANLLERHLRPLFPG